MDNDDKPVGRLLSRRQTLILLAGAGTGLLAACTAQPSARPAASTPAPATAAATAFPAATLAAPTLAPTAATAANAAAMPACVISPALTEGPLFVDEKLNRSDIRPDTSNGKVSEGAPFALSMRIGQVAGTGCTPLAGAMVDIWHCDAQGLYSDTTQLGMNTPGRTFLRGYQTTDAEGLVKFTTIYPGWYEGRAVHIHVKVRGKDAAGKNFEFTSQLFFDDAFSDAVYTKAPYNTSGARPVRNSNDGIYQQSAGQTLLEVTPKGEGYAAGFYFGVRM